MNKSIDCEFVAELEEYRCYSKTLKKVDAQATNYITFEKFGDSFAIAIEELSGIWYNPRMIDECKLILYIEGGKEIELENPIFRVFQANYSEYRVNNLFWFLYEIDEQYLELLRKKPIEKIKYITPRRQNKGISKFKGKSKEELHKNLKALLKYSPEGKK